MYCAGLLLVMGQHELGYLNVPILSCKQRLNQLRAGPEWSHPSNVVLLHHNNTNTKNNSDRLLFICTSKATQIAFFFNVIRPAKRAGSISPWACEVFPGPGNACWGVLSAGVLCALVFNSN